MIHILPARFKFGLLFFVFVTFIFSAFFAGSAFAANAIPDPIVPCTEEDYEDPEFNSLRPYQASPCREQPFATMCGNNITVKIATVRCDYNGNPTCDCRGDDCTATDSTPKHVVIDLSNVKLPILGNTQNVANSKNPTDEFDDAQKLNEYASWYLAGANQKAEYGEDSNSKIVNFSGPAKKLLPSAIQEHNRFATLWTAGVSNDITIDDQDAEGIYEDSDPTEPGTQTEETANHNQIVVCTTNNLDVSIFGFDITIPWVGPDKPAPCYPGGGVNQLRLIDWWGSKVEGLIGSVNLIEGWDGSQVWGYRTPPFPWQFTENIYYQKAYSEWRGKTCLLDSFVGNLLGLRLLCADIRIPGTRILDIKTNKWADLYQYIPLSNPVDLRGKEFYGNVHTTAPDATFSDGPDYVIVKVPRLFYPHTLEVSEATVNLNKTFIPREGVDTKTIPELTEENTKSCQLLNVRINPGDDLTFDNRSDKHTIDFTVTYDVDQVECKDTGKMTQPKIDPITGLLLPPEPIWNCESDIYSSVSLTTYAPLLDKIWEDTTAGGGSTFRRIFPKVEPGAPVSCVADIPGVSSASYNIIYGAEGSSDSVSDLVVKNPPSSTSVSPEIYFPHLGSVYEYFLKGIQTALRPQGYGEPITNGASCIPAVACGEWESKLAGSGGACGICNAPIGELAKKILTAAGTAYNVPAANIWAAMRHEGADWDEFRNQFTDENVRKWSNSLACGGEPMPGCDPDDKTTSKSYAPFGFLPYWFYNGEGSGALWTAVQVFDPTRNSIQTVSHCNFLDAAFAAAKHLQSFSGFSRTPAMCYGYNLASSVQPASCSSSAWTPEKIVQSQVGYWIGTTPWCPDGNGGPSPLANNVPIPGYAGNVLSDYNSSRCQ